ncbi:MAG: hypothetical protein IT581_04260 [Verrucomicrobiales bacterium]|nr:hypothetical protein [Verrucomicrobiales bacterium]
MRMSCGSHGRAWMGGCALGLSLLALPLSAADLRLRAGLRTDGRLEIAWPASAQESVLESSGSVGSAAAWSEVAATPSVVGDSRVVLLPQTPSDRFFRLRGNAGAVIVERVQPRPGETGVAVTRETVMDLSAAVRAVPGADGFGVSGYAAGRRLVGRWDLSGDGKSITWFPLEPIPGASRVRVEVQGETFVDAAGRALDADGDGVPGGVGAVEFDTLGNAGVAGTVVVGRVLASEKNAAGQDQPLARVTITVDGAEESLRTITDTNGYFRLEPAPTGRFFVHVDGRTATASDWPGGAYYPVVGKAWEAVAGVTNNPAGGNGLIYLPRVQDGALQAVSPVETTVIRFVPEIAATNTVLAGVEVRVPPNALFNEAGQRGGRVGIAPVAADRLPEPLPPGLQFPLVITIQTDGPANFDQPVPVRFPNLPDPVTGVKLPPGAKTALWSFNHDTGRWEPQGTMTISADGNFADTDPGVGVRQPGWHGTSPSSEGDGDGPAPCETCDDDDDDDPPPPPDDPYQRCKSEIVGAATSAVDCLQALAGTQVGALKPAGAGCGFGAGYGAVAAARDCLLDSGGCGMTVVNGVVGTGIGCAEFAAESLMKTASKIGPFAQVAGLFHGCILGAGLNVCGAVDCVQAGTGAACVPDEWEDGLLKWTGKAWDRLNPFDGKPALPGLHRNAGLQAAGEEIPAPDPAFFTEAAKQPILAYARLATVIGKFYETLYGSPVWLAREPLDAPGLSRLLTRLNQALEGTGPEGLTVSAGERAELHAMPLPSGATPADLDRLIDRMERFVKGQLPNDELRLGTFLNYGLKIYEMQLVYESQGWTEPEDALRAGLIQLTESWQSACVPPRSRGLGATVAGGGGGGGGGGGAGGGGGGGVVPSGPNGFPGKPPRPLSWALWNQDSGFVQRGKMTSGSPLPSLILAPNTFYRITYIDEPSGAVAVAWFRSGAAGQATKIPCPLWLDGAAASFRDSDGDGLSDVAEDTIGSDILSADTDGDGILDRVELASGGSPLQGTPLPVGSLARTALAGVARDITVARGVGYVAADSGGVAILRLESGQPPVLVGQFPTPGTAVALAADREVLAVAMGDRGLRLYDLTDPEQPVPRSDPLNERVNSVALTPDWVLAGAARDVVVLVKNTGLLRWRGLPTPGTSRIDAIAAVDDWVYVLTDNRLLTLRNENGILLELSAVTINGGASPLETGRELLVAGSRIYVGYFTGFTILDRSVPGTPVITGVPPSTQAAVHSLVAASPRLLLPTVSFSGTPTLAVGLYDVSLPTDPTRFITSINTVGETRATAIDRGLAYVADGPGGVSVVNFLERSIDRIPPTVAIGGRWARPDASIEPGARLEVEVDADDNQLVREVALLVNGTTTQIDGGYPFLLRTTSAGIVGQTMELRAVATDLAGNSSTSAPVRIALKADATPPLVKEISPSPRSTVVGEVFAGPEVVLSEEPTVVPTDALRLWSQGSDNVLGTADDELVPGTLVREGRTLKWQLTTPVTLGRDYRAELVAGIGDAAGNRRADPIRWIFNVSNQRSRLTSVSPNGLVASAETLTSNLLANLSLSLPLTLRDQVSLVLTSPGSDAAWGTADDVSHPVSITAFTGAQFALTATPSLPIGSYRLRAAGPGITTAAVDFALLDPRSFWLKDTSELWSDRTAWSRVPANDSVVILSRPNAEVTITNQANLPALRSVLCEEAFVHRQGDFSVAEEALFLGPFDWSGGPASTDDATLVSGTFRFRGGLEITGSNTGNDRPAIGAATVINEGIANWNVASGDVLSTNAVFINARGAQFNIGGTAALFTRPGFGLGRMINLGLMRKTGTNTTTLDGFRMQNDGRIEVASGRLGMIAYSGVGDTLVESNATIVLGTARLNVQGRIFGSGTVLVAPNFSQAATTEFFGRLQAGLVDMVGSTTYFRNAQDSPDSTYSIRAPAVFDAPMRLGALVLNLNVETNVVNAPLQLTRLHAVRGQMRGSGSLTVNGTTQVEEGRIALDGGIRLSGRLTADVGTSTGIHALRVASTGVILDNVEVATTNPVAFYPVDSAANHFVHNVGTLTVSGPSRLDLALILTNSGKILITGGTLLSRSGADLGGGRVLRPEFFQGVTGETRLAGGTLEYTEVRQQTFGGLLAGVGSVVFPRGGIADQLDLRGRFEPGAPAGVLNFIECRLRISPTCTTTFTVGPEGTAEVRATRVRLGGNFVLKFTEPTPPAVGTSWRLFTGRTELTFASAQTEGLPGDRGVELEYLADGVVARVVAR